MNFIPEKYLDDKDVIKAALQKEGSLGLASERLRNDIEMILLSVEYYKAEGSTFCFIPDKFFNNRKFALKVLSLNGLYFEHLPEHFKNDREMALTAVFEDAMKFLDALLEYEYLEKYTPINNTNISKKTTKF